MGAQQLKDWGLENVHTEEWGPLGGAGNAAL